MTEEPIATTEVKREIKSYILKEFLQGADPSDLTDASPLITGGVLDSISTVRLVSFIEERFSVRLHAHEMSADYLDNLDLIAATIQAKRP